MRIRPASLTARLVMTSVGLVALFALLVSVATSLAMRNYLVDQLDGDVRAQTPRLLDAAFGSGRGGPSPEGVAALIFDDGEDSTGVHSTFGPNGQTALTDAQVDALSRAPADRGIHTVDVPGIGAFRVQARSVQAGGEDATAVAGLPLDDVQATMASLRVIELSLGIVGVALAFGGSLLLVRRQLAPLRQVAGVAQEVTRLDLSQGSVGETVRVPLALTDESTEVGQVGASLNSLLGHVENALDARERSEQQVRQFVADASHELRTPLTTIRGYAELAERNPEALPAAMDKVYEESQRMSRLVDDLLLLARLDSGRPLLSEPVDLTQLVIDAVDDARVIDPGRTYALELPEIPVQVRGDELRLHQVLTNLLGNVRSHTAPGITVTTRLHPRVGADDSDGPPLVDLCVHDTGSGIPGDLDVFDRFTRGDSARTRSSGGAGLGLSLVAAIVKAHSGQVSVASAPGDTTFTVTLPAAAPD